MAPLLRLVCTADGRRRDRILSRRRQGRRRGPAAGGRPRAGRLPAGAATRNRVASSPKRACSWTPIGTPSAFHHSGTLMAGWPLTFASGVNGMNANTCRTAASMTPGRRSRKPRCSATSTSWANASAPRGASAPMRGRRQSQRRREHQVELFGDGHRAAHGRFQPVPRPRRAHGGLLAADHGDDRGVGLQLAAPARRRPRRSSARARSAAISTHVRTKKSRAKRVAVDVQVGLLDVVAQIGEQARGVVGGGGAVGVGRDGGDERALGQRDAQASRRRADLGGERARRRRRPVGGRRFGAGDRVQHRGAVADACARRRGRSRARSRAGCCRVRRACARASASGRTGRSTTPGSGSSRRRRSRGRRARCRRRPPPPRRRWSRPG